MSNDNYYFPLTVPGDPELEVRYSIHQNDYKGCILFVHGICHGAWCFEEFLKYFSKNGYDCYALSFRGHGESDGRERLNEYTLADYTDDVRRCIEYCKSDKCEHKMETNPYILGHSMGGAVVQKYIGEHSDAVRGAILFASATAGGMNAIKTLIDTKFNDNLTLASMRASGKLLTDEELFKSAFFDCRVPIDKIQKYNSLLQAESIIITNRIKPKGGTLYSPYTKNYEIDIPILVIGSKADSYFGKRSLKKTARKYKCSEGNSKKQLVILDELCHDMMLDPEWEKPAKVVLEFMDKNK